MDSRTQSSIEFGVGETFLFAVVWKWALELIDAYARWDVAMSVQRYIPSFLLSPISVPALLVLGLILIHRALQRRVNIVVTEAAKDGVTLHDQHGKALPRRVRVPSVWVTVAVVASAVLIAAISSGIWIMNYNPTPGALAKVITVPKICKTSDCWPKPKITVPAFVAPKVTQVGTRNVTQIGNGNNAPQINATQGIGITGGTVNNPTVINAVPPAPKLSFTEEAFGPTDGSTQSTLKIHITTERAIPGATIGIRLSAPFEMPKQGASEPILKNASASQLSWGGPLASNGTEIPNTMYVVVNIPAAFFPGQELIVPITSSVPVHVLEVASITLSAKQP